MKNMKKSTTIILCSVLFTVALFLMFYFILPAINLKSSGFYFILAIVIGFIVAMVLYGLSDKLRQRNPQKVHYKTVLNRQTGMFERVQVDSNDFYGKVRILSTTMLYSFIGFVALMVIFSIVGSKLFRANSYYKQLDIKEGTAEELETVFNFDNGDVLLPIIDKDLAFKLAQASLGDYGAQYTLDYENFTLISVNRNGVDELVRIAPLEYSNFFVSLNRMNQGTIGYIEVNVVTKKTTLVTYEDGLKYMPSALLGKDLDRHIRFNNLTALYTDKFFEIDDEGHPYWVVPTYTNKIGVINGPTPTGTIIVDPISGKTDTYKIGEEPKWVDRVVNPRIVEEQTTNSLKYKNGFFNVYIGQKKDVFQLSEGYNYFIKDGQTYYVSCITSPNDSDQTSIGFVTINLKTKEATKYLIKGITEMRAREIAMNDARVKAQQLDATWPILIDYQGIATYFMVLKNDVQAQKIVLMNVENGEHIAMGNTIEEAKVEYGKLLADSGTTDTENSEFTGKVTNIRDLGTSIEFMIEGVSNMYFVVDPSISLDARFMKVGDTVTVSCKNYTSYYYVTMLTK